jgi:hypothetical protein
MICEGAGVLLGIFIILELCKEAVIPVAGELGLKIGRYLAEII